MGSPKFWGVKVLGLEFGLWGYRAWVGLGLWGVRV